MSDAILRLCWREHFFDGATQPQILDVLAEDGSILGQVRCTDIRYEPEIGKFGHLTATMIVEDAQIVSHGKNP